MEEYPTDENYYSLADVANIFEKSHTWVYQEVAKGNLPTDYPENKKIGMRFPKEAIDVIARQKRKERAEKRVVHYSFVPSTKADVWSAVENARRLYGPDDVISFERALEWRTINSEISMSVKQDGKRLAGMVTYLPLEEQVIHTLLRNTLRERDIPDEAIQQWSDPGLSVYIAGIAIVPSGESGQDAQRGRFLLKHAIKWAMTLQAQHDIKRWYGIGVSPYGQSLAQELGFRELFSLEDGKRKAYVLEDAFSNPSRLVQRILKRMEAQKDAESEGS